MNNLFIYFYENFRNTPFAKLNLFIYFKQQFSLFKQS